MAQLALTYKGELEFISMSVLDYPAIETGGDVFGFWTHSGNPVIQYVIGPGKSARRSVAFFNQDRDFLDESGKRLRSMHGLQHIGEWHSHHTLGLQHPSAHDSETVARAIRDYNLKRFLLVICTITGNRTDINGYLYSAECGHNYTRVAWVTFPCNSPLRDSSDAAIADIAEMPRTDTPRLGEILYGDFSHAGGAYSDVPSDAWIASSAGKRLFTDIVMRLRDKYDRVCMSLDDDFVSIQFSALADEFKIAFPREHPCPAKLVGTNRSHDLQWRADGFLAAATISPDLLADSLISEIESCIK